MNTDNEEYWVKRHKDLYGDIRSTGNLAKDIETNIKGYDKKISMLRSAIEKYIFPETFEGLDVLEVGCGVGMMAPDLLNRGALYTGIDISPEAIEQAKLRAPSGTFICNNAYDFKLNKCFDVVFCTDVLLHIVLDDNWKNSLNSMRAHVKSGGLILIKEEIYDDRRGNSKHVVSRSKSEYLNACASIGLYISHIEGLPDFYILTSDKRR